MAITSGFFDSENGDRTYDANQMSNYFDGIVSNGVYENVGDRYLVTAGSGMTVNVGSGRAIILCRWVKNDDTAELSLDPADSTYNRIDAVCLRLDMTARDISLLIKKGTPAASPVMPEITRNDTVYELFLASVMIPRGSTRPSSVTDLRPSTYCGWVTGVIKQVDTSDLFLQWQAAYEQQFAAFDRYMQEKEQAFNAWFVTLTQQLKVEAGITKYDSWWDIGGGSSVAPCPADYQPSDILIVFEDGKFLIEDTDYRITTSPLYPNRPVVKLLGAAVPVNGARIGFLILRSIIGQAVITGSLPTMSVVTNRPMIAGSFVQFGSETEPESES